MMDDLRSFIKQVERNDQLVRIKAPVSTKYEVAAITAKADGYQAVLFENIKGSDFRLVSNLVGTKSRFGLALDCGDDIPSKVASSMLSTAKSALVHKGKFMQNSSKDLSCMPIVTHFEKESGPFITSSIVHVVNPETGRQNSSFHRMMPIDGSHLSIRMVEGRHLDRCFKDAKEHGQDLSVAVTIGVHPAISIAGAYQAQWGQDEMILANALLNKKLTLAKLPNGITVPSKTEIVMQGRILQDRTHEEWMVEMLQTYDHKREQPVFELERLYFRTNPIFHDILSGFAEHRLLMGMPIESKLYIELTKAFEQVTDVSMTSGGCNWLHAVVQIKKKTDADPKEIIQKTFEQHRSLKQVTIIDSDIDPDDASAVEYAMATRFQADRDLVIIRDVRGSSLDPSSNQEKLRTAKMGIDATRPLSKRPEGFEIARIPNLEMTDVEDSLRLN